jgi:hypothetical protein
MEHIGSVGEVRVYNVLFFRGCILQRSQYLQYTSNGRMIDGMINWKGIEKKQSWLNSGAISVFVWRDWVKQWDTSNKIAGIPVEIRTYVFLNTSLER